MTSTLTAINKEVLPTTIIPKMVDFVSKTCTQAISTQITHSQETLCPTTIKIIITMISEIQDVCLPQTKTHQAFSMILMQIIDNLD